jgi:hypothetical protein
VVDVDLELSWEIYERGELVYGSVAVSSGELQKMTRKARSKAMVKIK